MNKHPGGPAGPTRRGFLEAAAAGAVALGVPAAARAGTAAADIPPIDPLLAPLVEKLRYLTPAERFGGFVREKPAPYSLAPERLRAVGLDRDTWRLEVVTDPQGDCKVGRTLSKADGTALDFAGLMKLAERHAVQFIKSLTCTNVGTLFGTGVWEGVPLREVVWLTRPKENVRRVAFDGFHNDAEPQRFLASLTLARVLEDSPGELPVILCYKYNGAWLSTKMGGPVRMIVPDAYGNKCVKWVQRVLLSNSYQASDTYATWNNDTESPMKTFARFLAPPATARAGQPLPLVGQAQAGLLGLSRVQYAFHPKDVPLPADDTDLGGLDWHDAQILPPPADAHGWGGGLPGETLPPLPLQFDPATGAPRTWPLRYTMAHWAAVATAPRPGRHLLLCRTVDAAGQIQPMPRPLPHSGVNTVQKVEIEVSAC
jgi:DMSO/TMAO reductase YedYZ molybdopterin-dependent catalytic subunit